MLRLLTFGGLSLVDDGVPVTGAASQRSRLALLAVLAAAGPAGVSRDKLLACLWPESDDERARHALKQAVYALRRDLGNENAIAGTASLTLDPTIVSSDIREFEEAIARGDDVAAVALYAGPFLDGVFVRGAAEFDLWAGTERGRLERMNIEAIGRLARNADEHGDAASAVQWWRRAAAAEPVSGRVALALMRAMADSGDVSTAIQHARVHDAVVRAELDSPADEAVISFAEELKRGDYKPTVRAPKPVAPAGHPVTPTAATETTVPSLLTSDAPLGPISSPVPIASTSVWRRVAPIAAAVFAVLVLVVLVSPRARRAIASLTSSPEASKQIVVAVFDNHTGDKSLDPWGELAADVVIRALNNSNFTVVDTRTSALATRWIANTSPAGGSEGDRAAALAAETMSGTVVTGNYYRQGDTLRFEANIIDAAKGVKLHSIGPLRGPVADADKLVTELANRVSARFVSRSDSTAGAPTAQLVEAPSIEAYEHTRSGWEMFFARPFDTTAAFAELGRAIALDSSYTTPVLMRGYILDVKARWEDLAQVVAQLDKQRSRMGRVERSALTLFESDLHGDLLGRLAASRELARLSPGSPDMTLLVAISAMYINRAAEARTALLKTRTDRGINQVSPMYWAWRAATEHALGHFGDERSAGEQELKWFPNSPTAPLAFTRAYAARGNVGALEAELKKAGLNSNSAGPEAMNLSLLAGRELRAHGHASEAQALFARLAALPLRSGATPAEAGLHAAALYEAGDYRHAHEMFSALAQRDTSDVDLLGRAATTALKVGDTASVRALQLRLSNWSRPFAMGEHTLWLAHLAALAGHDDEAISLLHQAIKEGYRPMDLGAITLHEDGDFASLWKNNAFVAMTRPQDGPAALP